VLPAASSSRQARCQAATASRRAVRLLQYDSCPPPSSSSTAAREYGTIPSSTTPLAPGVETSRAIAAVPPPEAAITSRRPVAARASIRDRASVGGSVIRVVGKRGRRPRIIPAAGCGGAAQAAHLGHDGRCGKPGTGASPAS